MPFQRFFSIESSAGILLIFFTVLAMIMANSPLADWYNEFLNRKLSIRFGSFSLDKPLLLWINDGLMAIFFFMVGLEIKRELITGELSSLRKSALPIAAAIGGMVVPAGLFLLLNMGKPGSTGWGIPMATDIAFSLGILSLLGRRVPLSLKVLLAAFAIVDDIGAVMVIALFYSTQIFWNLIGIAAILFLVLFLLNAFNVRNLALYAIIGAVIWYLFLKAGIHPTLAGVLIAFTIPLRRKTRVQVFVKRMNKNLEGFCDNECEDAITLNHKQIDAIDNMEDLVEEVQSPLQSLEHRLSGFVKYFVMPLFAFANAGVALSGHGTEIFGSLSINIATGLAVGKVLGIGFFAYLAVRLGLAVLPEGINMKHVLGIGFLGGIGFTMSLFISNLAFGGMDFLNQAKIGVLLGSLVSGIAGYLILHYTLPKQDNGS